MATVSSLHTCTVQQPRAAINRIHIFLHFIAILFLFYYRVTGLFYDNAVPTLAWSLMTLAELIFAFVWVLSQAFRWRPVLRSVIPERIPKDVRLPAVDILICTADPLKEPTVEVMNTVLSAMALDYPAENLAVYLSDDGGSPVTLFAMKQVGPFAKLWLPFCNKYGIKTRHPESFFSAFADDERLHRSDEFRAEEEAIKDKYEEFKRTIEKYGGEGKNSHVVQDRPPHVEIIHDTRKIRENSEDQAVPLLVYVSREKRPSYNSRFKAGALNTLLRVSGVISNSPYVLVLDCDMYCNDPTSARQAMCFHLDPQMSRTLSFVQFPQVFYNVSKNDIYDGQARAAFKTKWQGMDGLRGPLLSGTGFYLKRKSLYGSPNQEDDCLLEPHKNFGKCDKLIESVKVIYERDVSIKADSSDAILQDAKQLASCPYETNTSWGKEVGFSYDCLLESTFTGYLLHCRGWTSVYLYPKKPCFLGCTPVDMKEAMVQYTKWISELFLLAISRFNPLTFGISRMSILQSMCYGYLTIMPILSVAMIFYATVPQLCLLRGVPLFPKVSDPWFAVFLAIFVSSLCQHLIEVLTSDGTLKTWWNEQRNWVIKSGSGSVFGALSGILKWFGMKIKFGLSNKAVDKEKLEKYEKGKFDFQGAAMFMVPLTISVILNTLCLIGGLWRVITLKNFEEMSGQFIISLYFLALSYPILEGLLRKGKGKA
ncbi:Cellulose synthase [Quillaja saponaria]|uniref:Cellulose synthase n=1 Tax=Quillaja saponaria TaxID=32244 RepID=A0AAD7LAV3_QUISA|nr:Cellulose synthase [Quillaja saponaria]WEU75105.1 CSLM2 [Quillaja saponaria]